MLLLACDNIYRVHQNEQLENVTNLTDGIYIFLQFFLLGVSSIYIVQNITMLIGFLPVKTNFLNDQYFTDVDRLVEKHIDRYSDKQVSILHSLFCVLYTWSFFTLNYCFQFLPRNLAIWIVLASFPFILWCYESITNNSKI